MCERAANMLGDFEQDTGLLSNWRISPIQLPNGPSLSYPRQQDFLHHFLSLCHKTNFFNICPFGFSSHSTKPWCFPNIPTFETSLCFLDVVANQSHSAPFYHILGTFPPASMKFMSSLSFALPSSSLSFYLQLLFISYSSFLFPFHLLLFHVVLHWQKNTLIYSKWGK